MSGIRNHMQRVHRPQRLPLCLLVACASGAALSLGLLGSLPGAGAATAKQRLTVYSVAEQEQFINHSDDRIRGGAKNPFGNFNDVTQSTTNATGPFPGDQAIFSFNLYADANLTKQIGAAIFTCQYNYAKNAFCDASFRLAGRATLVAQGGFNFNTASFVLAVTGGTGAYATASGALAVTPSAHHAERLVFELA